MYSIKEDGSIERIQTYSENDGAEQHKMTETEKHKDDTPSIKDGFIMLLIGILLAIVITAVCANMNTGTGNVAEDVIAHYPSYELPETWRNYTIKNRFSVSVPGTVELREGDQTYTRQMKNAGLDINKDAVVFQQKGLSNGGNDNHYCRIIISYIKGELGEFPRKDESFAIDVETRNVLREIVDQQLGSNVLLQEPIYSWIDVNGCKAIKIMYRRKGNNDYSTNCTIYLLSNYSEMVQLIVSYREQEKELWASDFEKIIQTFKWVD